MATSNPPEPAAVKPSATVVLQDGKPKVVPRHHPRRSYALFQSEDDEQTWSLEREFLSTHSKTLGLVLSYSPKKAAPGVKDPIKNMRGFLRFGDNLDNLQLDDVKADDFDVFLSGLRASNNTEFTLEERQIILTLASDWGFEDLRNRTIREIEKLHPSVIDRVVLARRCKIAKWIRGALLSLTILPDPLTATEIQILGTTTAALIWKAREEIFLHRLQVLTTKGRPASQIKCAGASCKQAVREAMLRVLEKPGATGKAESDLVGLVESELKAPQSGQEALPCDACKAGTGLKDGVVELVEEFKLARIIMEVQLGKEGGKWLEPV
ncbi:hypothetical protein M407DRAFT_11256 [Tulasnella calospora MUT 4182]|uniref:BTB domain-containing protein n=1 Tax=Tulasnella calospora MUT 4182 TaxID=1051891 RepID=A0A0C3Q723_9AGAM|nr:hypothetical protein M407DRAFT_11256 [Tulasnella calospora MUT 4182]